MKTIKDLIALFKNEDVFFDKDFAGCITIRPGKEYCCSYERNFILKIMLDKTTVRTAGRITLNSSNNIICEGIHSYDMNVNYQSEIVYNLTKELILAYNDLIKEWKNITKNKKIAEIREICDQFSV